MKIIISLIGVFLLSVLTGCHKPQASEIIGAAEATIKTTALAAITAKHPEVSSSDLKFASLDISVMPNGNEEIYVTYDVLASGKMTTETLHVGMSLSGKIEQVYKGSRAAQ
ncbi:MAG TPA: hypothetical protein VE344_12135 [Methylomirabilota bacterium]|nr:hypothetical protein [Methylomirabilota bacterium]